MLPLFQLEAHSDKENYIFSWTYKIHFFVNSWKKPYLYPSHPIRFTTTANSKVLSFLYSWSTPIFNPQENIKHQKVKHHPSNIRKYYQGKWDVEAYPSSSNFPHNVSNRGSRTTWAENRNKKNYVKNYYEAFLQMGWHIAENE